MAVNFCFHCDSTQTPEQYIDCKQQYQYYGTPPGQGLNPYANQAQTEFNYGVLGGEIQFPSGYHPSEYPTYGNAMRSFQIQCNTTGVDNPAGNFFCDAQDFNAPPCGEDPQTDIAYLIDPKNPEAGLQCISGTPTNDFFSNGLYFGDQDGWTVDMWNSIQWYYYKMARMRIEALYNADPGINFDDIWPAFYWLYDSAVGKQNVDQLISSYEKKGKPLPQALVDALKTNYNPVAQTYYCILNQNDFSTVYAQADCPAPASTNKPCWFGAPGDFGTCWYLPPNIAYTDAQLAAGMQYFKKLPIFASDFTKSKLYGNPFWSKDQYLKALEAVLKIEVDGSNFLQAWAQAFVDQGLLQGGGTATGYLGGDQGPGESNWTDDPDYQGNLPKLAYYAEGQEPWHKSTVESNNTFQYKNPCLSKPFLEKIIPIVGGMVAGGFGGMFVPGNMSKAIAAGTFGGATYVYLQGVVGIDAIYDVNHIDEYKKTLASYILSIGLPATLWEFAFEEHIIPKELETNAGNLLGLSAAAIAGYFLLEPFLAPQLGLSGSIFEWIGAPIAFLDSAITYLANGCDAHEYHSSILCTCDQANDKKALAEALAGPIYGCTDEQLTLRTQCLNDAFLANSWGPNPTSVGECNIQTGFMTDPTDCLSAGEWAYGRWQTLFTHEPAMAALATQKWNDCKHCVQIDNPSFMPPRDVDKPCSKYGPHFRMINGQCMDMTKPPGQQEAPNSN